MSSWMLYATLVSLLIGAAAWILERAVHMYRAPLRWIWMLGLIGSCVVPLAARFNPAAAPATQLLAVGPGQVPTLSGIATSSALAPSYVDKVLTGALQFLSSPTLPSRLDPLAAGVWTLLTLVVVSALGGSFASLSQSRRSWTNERLDGRDVLVSDQVGPAVVGVVEPEIVVPRWAFSLPSQDRALILRHEEEHCRAGDLRLVFGSLLLLALLPWNVALWWQVRRLRMAVELDCDRRVLGRDRHLRRYATLLIDMGRRRGTVSRLGALALAYPAPFLERRIDAMTTRGSPRFDRTAAFAMIASVFALAAYRVEAPPVAAGAVETPRAQRVARVTGRVMSRDSGDPLNDVQVQIELPGSRLGTISSDDGVYAISNLPPGAYQVRAHRVGLTSATRQIKVAGGETVEVDFEMSTYTVGLPERISMPITFRP